MVFYSCQLVRFSGVKVWPCCLLATSDQVLMKPQWMIALFLNWWRTAHCVSSIQEGFPVFRGGKHLLSWQHFFAFQQQRISIDGVDIAFHPQNHEWIGYKTFKKSSHLYLYLCVMKMKVKKFRTVHFGFTVVRSSASEARNVRMSWANTGIMKLLCVCR